MMCPLIKMRKLSRIYLKYGTTVLGLGQNVKKATHIVQPVQIFMSNFYLLFTSSIAFVESHSFPSFYKKYLIFPYIVSWILLIVA